MTDMFKTQYKCLKCDAQFSPLLYNSVNITLNPELIERLYDGDINVIKCPKCHDANIVNKSLLFHDMTKREMIEIEEGRMPEFWLELDIKGYFDELHKKRNPIRVLFSDEEWKLIIAQISSFVKHTKLSNPKTKKMYVKKDLESYSDIALNYFLNQISEILNNAQKKKKSRKKVRE